MGQVVGKEGIKIDRTKLGAITKWETPRTLTELRKIQGLGNFFRCLIVGYISLTACLTDLTGKKVGWKPESPWLDMH